jgi:hypothetical protein
MAGQGDVPMPALLLLLLMLALAAPPAEPPGRGPKADADAIQPDPAWKPLDNSLWFDARGRRLILRARVVLREGALEHLLCLKGTKEHEAILATDAAPYKIHAGLLATGAQTGHPVQFLPRFVPPSGDPIAIALEWRQGGTTHHADAREWVRDERAKTTLKIDWVFAGSEFIEDPATKKPVYAAEDGDLITVANFMSAILDLPFASTANDAERLYVANTERIPPRGTTVLLILKPRDPPPKPAPRPPAKTAPRP